MLTDEQRAFRIGKITSSIAAACLDLNPFSSPYKAFLAILGRSTFQGNWRTQRGNYAEAGCLAYAADQFRPLVLQAPSKGQMPVFNPKTPWMCDMADAALISERHPPKPPIGQTYDEDGLYPHEGIEYVIEAKTADTQKEIAAKAWGRAMTDQIPIYYKVQAHIHMIHYPSAKACLIPVLKSSPFDYFLYKV